MLTNFCNLNLNNDELRNFERFKNISCPSKKEGLRAMVMERIPVDGKHCVSQCNVCLSVWMIVQLSHDMSFVLYICESLFYIRLEP